ncbi:zf-U1-domain-containing protein [Penicillium capsulatum]|nr:zf-U1-domain-containing protein [Penicillium capsulatum]
MPKYKSHPIPSDLTIRADLLCDYCDVYLTHDSMSVRKAHNSGRNHLRNVVEYYQQIGQEKAQSVIDSITSSYAAEGQPVPNPAMVPPGAFPPPFGFPGTPLQHHGPKDLN